MKPKNVATLLLAGMALVGMTYSSASQRAIAHGFQTDESANFIVDIYSAKVHLMLAGRSFDNPDAALLHIEHVNMIVNEDMLAEIAERNERIADDIPAALEDLSEMIENGADRSAIVNQIKDINNLFAEAISVRIEPEHVEDTKVKALIVAGFASDALAAYEKAVGVASADMASMDHASTEQGSTDMVSMTNSITRAGIMMESALGQDIVKEGSLGTGAMDHPSSEEGGTDAGTMEQATGEHDDTEGDHEEGSMESSMEQGGIVDHDSYRAAKAFASLAKNAFLRERLAADGNADAVAAQRGLEMLHDGIYHKKPIEDVTVATHINTHPNLQKAFGLEIATEGGEDHGDDAEGEHTEEGEQEGSMENMEDN